MFSKKDLSILDWWLFYIIMIIPLVNILVVLVLLFQKDTNKTLKNYLLASILPVVIMIILWFSFIAAIYADL